MGAARIARRTFLGLAAVAAGGVAFGYYLYRRPYANPLEGLAAEGAVAFNPFVQIDTSDRVTVIVPRAEMGQGVETTLAALVAEELDVALEALTVVHGPASPAYYNAAVMEEGAPFPFFSEDVLAEAARDLLGAAGKVLGLQITGGSTSTVDAFERMRLAGAAARETLRAAAAEIWLVDLAEVETRDGMAYHHATERSLRYGELATTAAGLAPPARVTLRPERDWRLLGRSQEDVRGRDKVTGAPIYGIDVVLPDMLHGTVRMSPHFGVGHQRVDRAAAEAVPGVIEVIALDTPAGRGFGVIAENTWAAFRGAEALAIVWEPAPYSGDAAALDADYAAALAGEPAFSMGGSGDPDAVFAGTAANAVVEAVYDVPFLAHATMEPMNATARLADGRLDIWLGSQAPGMMQAAAARYLDMPSENVAVHVTHLGGGFGRRAEIDFGLYAVALARRTRGRPVKVTWSREEDMRHDAYRPAARVLCRAAIRPGAVPAALGMAVAAPSVSKSTMGRIAPNVPVGGPDKLILDGAFNQPYTFPASAFRAHPVETGIPVGFWRSVGNSHNGFFLEGFLDEIAHASGLDPLELRLRLMEGDPRFAPGRGVLEDVAARSGWGETLPEGSGRGIAFVLSFGAWVAQVVEVSRDAAGRIRVGKVWCSADPGRVLDPRNYEKQLVSGILFGLSQAMMQEITFENGAVVQGNFDEFDAIRMAQCPEIEVKLLETSPRMGGAGEVGTPPAAPALGNAIFAATGQRLRRMPFGQAVRFA